MATNSTLATEKCPCCDNPWSRATGDFFAKLCVECDDDKGTNKDKTAPVEFGLSRQNMDLSVSPSDNFFVYANGSWMKNNPIPAGYPNWNTFLALHVQSQERCKALLEELSAQSELSAEEAKVAAFYAAAMDEEAIEQAGIKPMKPLLDAIDQIVTTYQKKDMTEYATLIGKLASTYGIYALMGTGASPDYKDSDHSLCQVSQGGIGLPDRDYYFDEDKQEKRDAYKKHVAMMLTLLEDPAATQATEEATSQASNIFDLEVQLAEAHMTRTENRDPKATYNKMSVTDLNARGKDGFAFDAYLLGSTGKAGDSLGEINVRNLLALERVSLVASTIEPEVLASYLRWHAVSLYAPYLSKIFVSTNFDFFEKIMSGTEEIKPRWKRAMAFTESALGEALGQLYCAKHFDEECKALAHGVVESVRAALEERLKEVDWMKSDTTRQEALKKMSRFRIKIGYPDKWIDYSTLVMGEKDDFLTMVFKSHAFDHDRESKEMNAETDREKWFMTPQTVNAYYHPSLNEIVFPAAILQHPFFDPEADDAVNFGAMGAVVGHEMTHGFDDKGRQFNFAGVLDDWWSEADATEYEKRVQVMVEQANAFEVHGKTVQGKLTSGENIADLGGLRLAFRALKSKEGFDDSVVIDGFTPAQRFFLAWAQCWRQNITKERSLQLLTLDPHGPAELRTNGPLSNIPEFHAAFDIPQDSAMYKPVETRVDIW